MQSNNKRHGGSLHDAPLAVFVSLAVTMMLLLLLTATANVKTASAAEIYCGLRNSANPLPICALWEAIALGTASAPPQQTKTTTTTTLDIALCTTQLVPTATVIPNLTALLPQQGKDGLPIDLCRTTAFAYLQGTNSPVVPAASLLTTSIGIHYSRERQQCDILVLSTAPCVGTSNHNNYTVGSNHTLYLRLNNASFAQYVSSGLCTDAVWCRGGGTARGNINTAGGCYCECALPSREGLNSRCQQSGTELSDKLRQLTTTTTAAVQADMVLSQAEFGPGNATHVNYFAKSGAGALDRLATRSIHTSDSAVRFRVNNSFPSQYISSSQVTYQNATPYAVLRNPLQSSHGLDFTHAASAAGQLASLRLFNIKDTGFDIGTVQHKPYTVSFWMRVDNKTSGFIFGVTDNYYESSLSADQPPFLLREAQRVIDYQLSAHKYAQTVFGHDFHMYGAVYVDGPSNSIMFLYSNDDDRQLNQLRYTKPVAFDGEWHYIVLLSEEHSRHRVVRIFVDGESDPAGPKWRRCYASPSSKPMAVRRSPPGRNGNGAALQNALTDHIYNNGVMFIGQPTKTQHPPAQAQTAAVFSVYDLRFIKKKLTQTQVIKNGNPAMEVHLYVRENESHALGFSVAVVVFVALISVIHFWYYEIRLPAMLLAQAKEAEEAEGDGGAEEEEKAAAADSSSGLAASDGENNNNNNNNNNNTTAQDGPINNDNDETTTAAATTTGEDSSPNNDNNAAAKTEGGGDGDGETRNPLSLEGASASSPSPTNNENVDAASTSEVNPTGEGGEQAAAATSNDEAAVVAVGAGGVAAGEKGQEEGEEEEEEEDEEKKEAARPKRTAKKKAQAQKKKSGQSDSKSHLSKLEVVVPMVLLTMQSMTLYFSGFDWPKQYESTVSVGFFAFAFDFNLATAVVGTTVTTATQYAIAMIVLIIFLVIRRHDAEVFEKKVLRRERLRRKTDRTMEEEAELMDELPKPQAYPTTANALSIKLDDKDEATLRDKDSKDDAMSPLGANSNIVMDSLLNAVLNKNLTEAPKGLLLPVELANGQFITVFGGTVVEAAQDEQQDETCLGTVLYAPGVRGSQPAQVHTGEIHIAVNPKFCPLHNEHLIPFLAPIHGEVPWKADGMPAYQCNFTENPLFRRLRGPLCSDGLFVCPVDSCGYSACKICFGVDELSPGAAAKMAVKTKLYYVRHTGLLSIVGLIAIIAAEAIYLPTIKTAFLILSCNAIFSCAYPMCWDEPTRDFLAAAGASIAMLVVYGLGLVVIEWVMIVNRKFAICESGLWDKDFIPPTVLLQGKWPLCCFLPAMTAEELEEEKRAREEAGGFTPVKTFDKLFCGLPDDVWKGILESDQSMLRGLYEQNEHHWMCIHPIYLFFKLAIVMVVLMLTSNTFYQLVGAAIVEFLQLLTYASTNALLVPHLDLLARIGSIHNLTQIMLVSFHRVIVAEDPDDTGLVFYMLSVTGIYFIGVIWVIVVGILIPFFKDRAATNDAREAERQARLAEQEVQRMVNERIARVDKMQNALASPTLKPDVLKKGMYCCDKEIVVQDTVDAALVEFLQQLKRYDPEAYAGAYVAEKQKEHKEKEERKKKKKKAEEEAEKKRQQQGGGSDAEQQQQQHDDDDDKQHEAEHDDHRHVAVEDSSLPLLERNPFGPQSHDAYVTRFAAHKCVRLIHMRPIHELLSENSYITELDLSFNKFQSSQIASVCAAVAASKSIKTLNIAATCSLIDAKVVSGLKQLCASTENVLEKLDFSNNAIVGVKLPASKTLFPCTPKLTSLLFDNLTNPGKTHKKRDLYHDETAYELAKIMKLNPHLASVSICNQKYAEIKGDDVVKELCELKSLEHIKMNNLEVTDVTSICTLIRTCKSLHTAELAYNRFSFESMKKIIKASRSLRQLNLARCFPVDEEEEQAFTELIEEDPKNLTRKHLILYDVSEEPISGYVRGNALVIPENVGLSIKACHTTIQKKKLSEITLEGFNGVGGAHLSLLLSHSKHCTFLQTLNITNNHAGDRLVDVLIPLLTPHEDTGEVKLAQLTSIGLSHNSISAKGIQRFVKALAPEKIESLSIGGNKFQPATFKAIAAFMKTYNSVLRELDVSKAIFEAPAEEIVAAFIEEFLPGVRASATLRSLSLAGLPLNAACLKAFVAAAAPASLGKTASSTSSGTIAADTKSDLTYIDLSDLESKDTKRTEASNTCAAELLARCKNIQELHCRNIISDAGRVTRNAANAAQLRHLDLSGCQVGGDGGIKWNHTNVETLDLSSNASCPPATAENLTKLITTKSDLKLKKLSVRTGDAPSRLFLKMLHACVENASQVEELDLRYEKFVPSGKAAKFEALPPAKFAFSKLKTICISLGANKDLRQKTIGLLGKIVARSPNLQYIRTPDVLHPDEKAFLLMCSRSNTVIRGFIENENPLDLKPLTFNPFVAIEKRNAALSSFFEYVGNCAIKDTVRRTRHSQKKKQKSPERGGEQAEETTDEKKEEGDAAAAAAPELFAVEDIVAYINKGKDEMEQGEEGEGEDVGVEDLENDLRSSSSGSDRGSNLSLNQTVVIPDLSFFEGKSEDELKEELAITDAARVAQRNYFRRLFSDCVRQHIAPPDPLLERMEFGASGAATVGAGTTATAGKDGGEPPEASEAGKSTTEDEEGEGAEEEEEEDIDEAAAGESKSLDFLVSLFEIIKRTTEERRLEQLRLYEKKVEEAEAAAAAAAAEQQQQEGGEQQKQQEGKGGDVTAVAAEGGDPSNTSIVPIVAAAAQPPEFDDFNRDDEMETTLLGDERDAEVAGGNEEAEKTQAAKSPPKQQQADADVSPKKEEGEATTAANSGEEQQGLDTANVEIPTVEEKDGDHDAAGAAGTAPEPNATASSKEAHARGTKDTSFRLARKQSNAGGKSAQRPLEKQGSVKALPSNSKGSTVKPKGGGK